MAKADPDTPSSRYPVPKVGLHRVGTTVRRSRFLASVSRAETAEAAKDFVTAIREEFPDATHHCWAFVAGPPGSTTQVGMSDDGEPHGTAGRPILNALLHSGVGEIVAVVTRWFGGVKLGTGGLVRAYAGAVTDALASLPADERVDLVRIRITVPFAALDAVHRTLDTMGASQTEIVYGEGAMIETRLPQDAVERLATQVAASTAGGGSVEVV